MKKWSPPWQWHDGVGARVVATTSAEGVRLSIETVRPCHGLASWLAAWVSAYLSRLPDGGREDSDFTFVYVVVGSFDGATPDGRVDGSAVLEAGYGGSPAGPDDAPPTTIAALFERVLDVLV